MIRKLQSEMLVLLPARQEMASMRIDRLDIIGFAPGGTALVNVNIVNVQGSVQNLVFYMRG